MSKNVEIILLEDVEGLGEAGEIVSVAEGRARNELFPNAQAALATDADRDTKTKKDAAARQAEVARLQALRDQASALEGTELTIEAKVKDGDEIFGSVTKAVIAERLQQLAKVAVKAKGVGLEEPLTTLGSVDVVVQLGDEVEAKVTVTVVPDEESREKMTDGDDA